MKEFLEKMSRGNDHDDDLSRQNTDSAKKWDHEEETEMENSPIEQVRLTVPVTDDPTVPALTFRTWTIGVLSCALLSFLNQFFAYRSNPLNISSLAAQIVALPIGRFMAQRLPKKMIRVPGTRWEFSLNPGPFNVKEHVLITIFANCGYGGVYAVHIVTITKTLYKRKISALSGLLLAITTQMLGYGWAGLFRRFLVDSPFMRWPANLLQVSLFRALNEKEVRSKRGTTRFQFFLIVFVCSFAWYILPTYLFAAVSSFPVLCHIFTNSVLAHQLGDPARGLGLAAFTLDWNTVASYLGSPLATPGFALFNVAAGFVLFAYILVPAAYWMNIYNAKRFPFISSKLFDFQGQRYSPASIINPETFEFDPVNYAKKGPIYLSTFFAIGYGLNFATMTAIFTHVFLFHGRSIIDQTRQTFRNKVEDVHTKLMRKNYARVPEWWFMVILVLTIGLAFWACLGFGAQLQLPWWGIILACVVAFGFTLPIGIITATTNQQPGLNVITEMIIGYLYPGRPLANVCFKTYGYISMQQAITFLQDFKLGQYMKIPPRSMFTVQLVGTLVSASTYYGTAWWLLTTVPDICGKNMQWNCPNDNVFFSASVIWGVVGPNRMFGQLGKYKSLNWWFLVGMVAPVLVWLLCRTFPKQKWLRLVHVPVIFGATGNMPPAGTLNYWSWISVGLFFNVFVYNRWRGWWAKHTYVLSAALDTGIAFCGVASFFALQSYLTAEQLDNSYGVQWWGKAAGCPLSGCPTETGITVEGCPVVT